MRAKITSTSYPRSRACSSRTRWISSRNSFSFRPQSFSSSAGVQIPPVPGELLPRRLQEVAGAARNDVVRDGAFDVDAHGGPGSECAWQGPDAPCPARPQTDSRKETTGTHGWTRIPLNLHDVPPHPAAVSVCIRGLHRSEAPPSVGVGCPTSEGAAAVLDLLVAQHVWSNSRVESAFRHRVVAAQPRPSTWARCGENSRGSSRNESCPFSEWTVIHITGTWARLSWCTSFACSCG